MAKKKKKPKRVKRRRPKKKPVKKKDKPIVLDLEFAEKFDFIVQKIETDDVESLDKADPVLFFGDH